MTDNHMTSLQKTIQQLVGKRLEPRDIAALLYAIVDECDDNHRTFMGSFTGLTRPMYDFWETAHKLTEATAIKFKLHLEMAERKIQRLGG